MENEKKYLDIFKSIFEVEESRAKELKYQEVQVWDSVGHMNLISEIEAVFDIMMDTEDIIEFNSYEKGKEILAAKYGVDFE